MKRQIRGILALLAALAAALGLAGNALALSSLFGAAAPNPAVSAFEGVAYHGDTADCAMTADEARALAVKLGELMSEYNENSYEDGFTRLAALVDLGTGVPALYYYQGVSTGESANPNGPGFNGNVRYFTEDYSAWEFKDGDLVMFSPGWFYGGYMVYELLSGNGRSGASYVVPIENGFVDVPSDEDGYFRIDSSQSIAWYEWYLGSMGDDYSDAYEDMNAGENDMYRDVLADPGTGAALGVFEDRYVGLGDASELWRALNSYAAARETADASDPAALVRGYGDVDIGAVAPELLRGYAMTLRGLPEEEATYYAGNRLYNFATLVEGGDGTVLLWVVPAVMDSDWWGEDPYFYGSGAAFVGRNQLVFGWDGSNVRDITLPGVSEIEYWPEGLELKKLYYGTDADGQNWEIMYGIENGGISDQPRWCHAFGFLYEYALEDAGIYGGIPGDYGSKLAVTREFFDFQTASGKWPELPLDWSTFTLRDMTDDTILFEVNGGDYQSFRRAHEAYNAEYDYSYLDKSAAGDYGDIETMPERWLLSDDLADRLDAAAAFLEKSNEPPAVDTDGGDGGDGSGDRSVDGKDRGDVEKGGASAGLIAGVVGGALIIGGGVGTAWALISRSRRKGSGAATETGSVSQADPRTPQAPADPRYPAPKAAPAPTAPQAAPAGFCPNCGAPHAAGARFCSKCGAKLQ